MLNVGLMDVKEGYGAWTVVHDHYEVDLRVFRPEWVREVLQ